MRKLELFLLGLAIGSVTGITAFDLAFPAVDPSVWRAYAEATGLCPLTTVSSVLWSKLVSAGLAPGLLSMLSVGVLVFAVFDFCWRMLVLLVCPSVENHNWWRITVPFLAFAGSALTAFSEPVWRMALSGSPTLTTLALFMLTCDLFLVPFFTATMVDEFDEPIGLIRPSLFVYAAFLLSGALSVELPVALLLPALFAVVRRTILPRIRAGRYREHPSELFVFSRIGFSQMVAVFSWIIGVAGAVVCSGVLKIGFLGYFGALVRGVADAASPVGWAVWTVCTLVPFAVVCRLLPVLTAKTGRQTFGRTAVAILVGVVSLAAVSPLVRGDWAFVPSAVVRAPFLQAFGAVLAAAAVTLTLGLFSYFAFHELDYGRRLRDPSACVVGLALALALAVAALGVRRESATQVRQAIVDAMEETVREAENLSWLFTDGSVDIGIELAARRHHRKVVTRPLVADGPLAVAECAEEKLRAWISGRVAELRVSGAQAGLDFWTRAGQAAPAASGLLARSHWPDGVRERGVVYAKALGARMAALERTGALSRENDPQVAEVFRAILRCLSRMADARGSGGML